MEAFVEKDCAYCDVVNNCKTKSAAIVDLFLSRQERAIPDSIEGGFSLFRALLQVVRKNKHECIQICNVLDTIGITQKHVSLCNWICFNVSTSQYHQDNDASYSMICSPFIDYDTSPVFKKCRGHYSFGFCWDEESSEDAKLSILLEAGVGIYFLGSLINHRQEVIQDGLLMNFLSYQNKRLFSNMKRSIERCLIK